MVYHEIDIVIYMLDMLDIVNYMLDISTTCLGQPGASMFWDFKKKSSSSYHFV